MLRLKELLKEAVYRLAPHRLHLPAYPYMVHPAGMAFLCGWIEKTAEVPGAVVEIGCAWGNTTLFLSRQMDWLHSDKTYFAIDTFGTGFPPDEVEHEVRVRGKDRQFLTEAFHFPGMEQKWFQRAMDLAEARRVQAVTADISRYDFDPHLRISFCFIDVDLYIPVRDALAKVYPLMSPGGVIVLPDCLAGTPYDGALQAYEEFVRDHGLPVRIEADLFGVISA